jgi:hypothetical protein
MNSYKHRSEQHILLLSVCICVHLWLMSSVAGAEPQFEKRWLTAIFYGEGANFGDLNKDGRNDIISGPYIYDGPEFSMKRAFMPVEAQEPLAYSQNFFAFVHDFNGDEWPDVLIIGFPGAEAHWYENPGNADWKDHWKRHLVFKGVGNESPTFADLTGDGKPELIFNKPDGDFGYATRDPADPTTPWTFHPISRGQKHGKFTHGLGIGDINGDGKTDLIEKTGWWEQPQSLDGEWKKHETKFADPGGAQMYAYDVNDDGLADVITSLHGHGYGLVWYEQVRDGSSITFKQRLILSPNGEEKINDVQFSQVHAIDLVDLDGDGIKDILTGKRFWAHGPKGDPEPNAPAVLYWFKLSRDNGKATYTPHLIDDNSGVGVQVVAGDISGNKKPDIVVGNKKGTFIFLHQ